MQFWLQSRATSGVTTDLGECLSATVVPEEKWPVLHRRERAAEWLRVWADVGGKPPPRPAGL